MKTLYEQNPSEWDRLEKLGRPNLKAMSKCFNTCPEMDRALGLQNTTRKYVLGGNASNQTELLAKAWMDKNYVLPAPSSPAESTTTFLVIAPPEAASRAQKILALMGCEFVEV